MQRLDRVLGDGGHGAGAHVGGGAHLQGDAAVPDEGGQAAEVGLAVGAVLDVVDDAHAVAQALGPAELDGLPDRRQAEGLAGVDGHVEVLPLHVLEGVQVPGGREALLGAGDVEADHAEVPVAHGQLGDLGGVGLLAHGRQQGAHDDAPAPAPGREPGRDRLDHLVEGQPAFEVLFGGVPDLGVDDPVGGQVLGALGRHPLDGVLGLHDPDGVLEGLEVLLQGVAARAPGEPAGQVVHVGRRQGAIAVLGRQLDDRCGSQPAVEVVVEQGLGRLPNGLEVEVGSHG